MPVDIEVCKPNDVSDADLTLCQGRQFLQFDIQLADSKAKGELLSQPVQLLWPKGRLV
jgi:hypothetical protein